MFGFKLPCRNVTHTKTKHCAYDLCPCLKDQRSQRSNAILYNRAHLYSHLVLAKRLKHEWKDFEISLHLCSLGGKDVVCTDSEWRGHCHFLKLAIRRVCSMTRNRMKVFKDKMLHLQGQGQDYYFKLSIIGDCSITYTCTIDFEGRSQVCPLGWDDVPHSSLSAKVKVNICKVHYFCPPPPITHSLLERFWNNKLAGMFT